MYVYINISKPITSGTLDMNIRMENTPSMFEVNTTIQFLYCTDTQIVPLETVHVADVCHSKVFDMVQCEWQTSLGTPYPFVCLFLRLPYVLLRLRYLVKVVFSEVHVRF